MRALANPALKRWAIFKTRRTRGGARTVKPPGATAVWDGRPGQIAFEN
jgi:hypothetical protein